MEQGSRKLVVSTMRDEGPYVLEWLAYHRAIGFDDFLIYTNDCRDGTDLLLDRLAASGHVTHVRNEVLRRGPHKSALKYALAHPAFQAADWVYVTDADEFLNIRLGDGRVDDLIARYPRADAVPVAWRMFSHSGHVGLGDQLLLEALTDCEPAEAETGAPGRFVKSLFRND
ncbi:MAG: glycosyltransferase family 2 protein, partial [Pseudomonadota bacterium]